MALITISGFPCSGKSRRAQQLKAGLEAQLRDSEYQGPSLKVEIISDDALNVDRIVYGDSRLEKLARGTLITSIQRLLSLDTILIVDAPNYIKGFRYQLYCAAREMKVRVCTVFVVATQDLCREWNTGRQPEIQYDPKTLENMFQRYEEPSSMVRWDSPLFTVPWSDENVPASDIFQAINSGIVKPPNSGTLNVKKAPTDALLILESSTLSVVTSILSTQDIAPGGGTVKLPLSPTLNPEITLPHRTLTLVELQRLKRQFVTVHKKAVTLGTTERGAVEWDEESVTKKFITYLEESMRQ